MQLPELEQSQGAAITGSQQRLGSPASRWHGCTAGITSCVAPSSDLPVDQAQGVDIGTFKRIKMLHVNGFIQDFGGHVPAAQEQRVTLEGILG